ncbi:glyoxalase superfamily protein [Constrictibacter sp. MBR-5]|uniref:glyoxalase superfamily protein n=1 Tax=Constrictibacter sp. MBR-5 TaxID=3156467 RepID=UPI00339743E4
MPQSLPNIAFDATCPILRIFDVAKAMSFYLDYLGFGLDWEHRFGDDFPLYAQISRAGLILHLSEHHGDGCPGAAVFVRMRGVRAYHAELSAKNYRYLRPAVEDLPWGAVMSVTDPFHNTIRFCEGPASR